jgi:hypothetical protein
MMLIQKMLSIAGSAGKESLKRVCLDSESWSAVVTDSFRLVAAELPGTWSSFEGRLFVEDAVDGDFSDPKWQRADWDDLHALAEPSDVSFPNAVVWLGKPKRAGALSWDGEGGWRHGKARKEFEIVLSQWSYFDAQRRKPQGMFRLEIAEGNLYYRLGIRVHDQGRMPTFWSFAEDRVPLEASVDGDMADFDGVLGTYDARYFASMWPGVQGIGVTSEDGKDPAWAPLFLDYEGGSGLLMPIRME